MIIRNVPSTRSLSTAAMTAVCTACLISSAWAGGEDVGGGDPQSLVLDRLHVPVVGQDDQRAVRVATQAALEPRLVPRGRTASQAVRAISWA